MTWLRGKDWWKPKGQLLVFKSSLTFLGDGGCKIRHVPLSVLLKVPFATVVTANVVDAILACL